MHFQAVNENAVTIQAAELTDKNYLEKIDWNLNNIGVYVSYVVLAQIIMFEELSNMKSALKNELAVWIMSLIIADLISYSTQIMEIARVEPYLLLFVEDLLRWWKRGCFVKQLISEEINSSFSSKPEIILEKWLKYCQGYYDFEAGGMSFIAPGAIIENAGRRSRL